MNFLHLLSFLNVFPITLTWISHLISLCVAQEEEIHSSLVEEHGGGGVSSTSFTVTMDMQPLCWSMYAKVIMIFAKIRKQKKFFETLIVRISGIAEGIFIFYMWLLLNGGHLHCKFGPIWIRHHGATDAWKSQLCCSCLYVHSVCACPVLLGRTHTIVCLVNRDYIDKK